MIYYVLLTNHGKEGGQRLVGHFRSIKKANAWATALCGNGWTGRVLQVMTPRAFEFERAGYATVTGDKL